MKFIGAMRAGRQSRAPPAKRTDLTGTSLLPRRGQVKRFTRAVAIRVRRPNINDLWFNVYERSGRGSVQPEDRQQNERDRDHTEGPEQRPHGAGGRGFLGGDRNLGSLFRRRKT